MAIDLIECVPQAHAESTDLDDLLDAARDIDTWTERHAEVLDYIYRYRLLRLLLSRRKTSEQRKELLELTRHFRQVTAGHRVAAMAKLKKSYPDRWAALRDLAADRIDMIESDAPRRLLERDHVREILKKVYLGEVTTQAEITRTGEFGSAANVTRIINMMDANGLIERRRNGKQNELVLTPEGEHAAEAEAPPFVALDPKLKAVLDPIVFDYMRKNGHIETREQGNRVCLMLTPMGQHEAKHLRAIEEHDTPVVTDARTEEWTDRGKEKGIPPNSRRGISCGASQRSETV
jgi:predicted transcriptional regulator